MDQNVGVLELGLHPFRIGDEVGREVAAVELHALDHFERGLQALGFFDRDHAFLADLLHRLGDDVADGGVVVGRDGADLGDFAAVLGGLGEALEFADHGLDGAIDAALERHRVVAGGDHLHPFGVDRAREHGRRGGAVTGDVGGLGGDLFDHLGAHVLELVFELDFLGDGYAVLGHGGRAEALLEHDVAPLGAERHGHGVGQDIDAAQNLLAGLLGKTHCFGCHGCSFS